MIDDKRPKHTRARQRGATMVSTMMLTVSLTTLGLLAVRSSVREVSQAGGLVARERALMAAQAAVDLASARYMWAQENGQLDQHLQGFNAQGGQCTDPCGDCIPDAANIATGQRNDILAGQSVGCGGRACMRQGAVAQLPDANLATVNWCDVPLRDLVPAGDAEARVSVWVRNNSADALGAGGSGLWDDDGDGRVVVTAMATVRNTQVTIEQEVLLSIGGGTSTVPPQTPDEGYGGGHNNDNSAVAICTDEYVQAQAP
jgi:hypothetical protein